MKAHLYFFLQVNNKADTRRFWFFCKQKIEKLKKKTFSCFCVNEFYGVIKFQKFDSCQIKKCVLNFWKKIQKKGLFILLLSQNRMIFYFEWKMKNWKKTNVLFVFFKKKKCVFGMGKEKMCVVGKNIYTILKKIKKKFFYEKCLLNKEWSA